MSESKGRGDLWWLLAALLWTVFFMAGLDPETLFVTLREMSGVVTQEAMINSPHVVTLAFAAYIGLFAYQRCVESGMLKVFARARALQFSIIGLVAFLNFSPLYVLRIGDIPVPNYRIIVVLVAFAKVTAWFYLLIVVMRYYILGQERAFASTASMFPSTYAQTEPTVTIDDQSTVNWLAAPPPEHPPAQLAAGSLVPRDTPDAGENP